MRDPDKVVWLSQTTLSVDETMETVRRLRERFPSLQDPPSDDICYATQNRQLAVKQMAADCDLVIVVGSRNSSNSVRLVEVALEHGSRAGASRRLRRRDRRGVARRCRRPWASPPARPCPRSWCARCSSTWPARGYGDVVPVVAAQESIMFSLPNEIRRDLKAAGKSDKMVHDASFAEAGSLH